MLFSEFKQVRLTELLQEQWGRERIPDLQEVFKIARPRSVLEIGCYQGVSTEFWLLHCQRVVAVDPWPEPAVLRRFLARCGHYPHLELVRGYSPAAIESKVAAGPFGPFDMVYIDGDHSYEAVKRDIAAARLVGTTWLAGHDHGGDCPGVDKAVKEINALGRARFCSDGSWLINVSEAQA